MKLMKNWKRIFAGMMACIMLFMSLDMGAVTAGAMEKEENVFRGNKPVEIVSLDKEDIEGEIYGFEELAQSQTFSAICNGEWDKYATYFYYNQLSNKWRMVWDALDAVCLEALLSEEDALISENLYHVNGIELPENTTEADVIHLVELFWASNPQYYFLSNMVVGSYDKEYDATYESSEKYMTSMALCIYNAFGKGLDRTEATSLFEEKIEEVEAGISVLGIQTDSAKLKYIHDYVVEQASYNHEITKDDKETEDVNESEITDEEDELAISQSAYSALCMESTVCTGYAEAMTLLCNAAGIDAISVTSVDHMWNKVRIDDSWYNLDATWADQSEILYQYYARSNEAYQDDEIDCVISHTELESWEPYLPLCTLDTKPESPYTKPGDFPEISLSTPIPNIVAYKTGSGEYSITINPMVVGDETDTIEIYYTTDGTTPSVASDKSIKYTEPFVVEEDYEIRAICVKDGYLDSAVVRGVQQVPMIESLSVDNRFYQKIKVSWELLGDKVDGYEITVSDFNTKEELQTAYVDKSESSYVIDTTNYEAGSKVIISVRSYVGAEGNVKFSGEYTKSSTVQKPPIEDVNLKWFVHTWRNTNYLAVKWEEDYLLFHYLKETGVNPYETGSDKALIEGNEHIYLFFSEYALYLEEGYVVVTDKDMTTAWQEPGIQVGGAFKEPVLQAISDVKFSATGQTATLNAIITNPMENFDYRYQWYVADSQNGDAVAIENATNATYIAAVDADETKYYFCRVTCEYGEIMYVDTENGNGGRTVISGSMVGADIQIEPIEDKTYTSLEITPEVVVSVNGIVLTKNVDYTVKYADNKNVGTARVIVEFCGNYTGYKTATFKIVPAGVKSEYVAAIPEQIYSGSKLTPDLVVTGLNGEVLEKGVDYSVSYDNNLNAGPASVDITFIKNYTGTIHSAFKINPKSLSDENIVAEDCVYTGSKVAHKLVVTDGRFTLVEGNDYEVIYAETTDRVNVGEVTAKVKFKKNYTGEEVITYAILPKSVDELTITAKDQEYTGTKVKTDVLVMDGEKELKEGVDYDVVYSNNIELSTDESLAIATLTFKGNYTGERTVEYKILPRDAQDCTVEFVVPNQVYSYNGQVIKPEVIVKYGDKLLVEDTDYTVVYNYDKNVGIKKVQVDFKGNYTGRSYVEFSVISKSISAADLILDGIIDFFFDGTEKNPEITIIDPEIKDENVEDETTESLGHVLRKGIDYVITFIDNIFAGIATIQIEFVEGGNYVGDIIYRTFVIKERTTEHVVISAIPEQRYTGSAITPEVVIKDTEIEFTLVKDRDYTVEYKNNINEGTATVVVSFKGNFKGDPMTTTFTIVNPVPTSITSNTFHVNQSTGYISKVTVGTTVNTLWSSLNERDYVVIYDKNGNVVSGTTVLATGMTAVIMDEGTSTKKYTVVVTGDTNGDGKINITDMIAVKACTLKKSGLSGAYEKAGDVNGDGKINITDFIKVKATTLKKDSITGVAVK